MISYSGIYSDVKRKPPNLKRGQCHVELTLGNCHQIQSKPERMGTIRNKPGLKLSRNSDKITWTTILMQAPVIHCTLTGFALQIHLARHL